MHGRKGNNLVLIENGQITSYELDDKNVWEIGRVSKDNIPDIRLHSTTVSRKHGRFQNMDGVWFYLDHNGKNGTVYNHKHLEAGLKGRIKAVMLNNGDTFVFGGGTEETINCKTIWGMYITRVFDERWRVANIKGHEHVRVISGGNAINIDMPEKGFVINNDDGIAIFMGNITFMIGDMEVVGC